MCHAPEILTQVLRENSCAPDGSGKGSLMEKRLSAQQIVRLPRQADVDLGRA